MDSQIISHHNYGDFKIYTPNKILKFRANSFSTKEPTTIEWIKGLESDSILIDVGANIGIYTIPCALFHVKKVIALEPEIKNYNMLLANLELNNLDATKVEALPLGISTEFQNQSTKIFITHDVAGASCHQVGRNQNYLLQEIKKPRKSKSIFCVSLSTIVKNIALDHDGPIHIKVDVDGIEEDVCQSLFNDRVISRISSLQIELNPTITSHLNLIKRLSSSGFNFSQEQVNESIRKSGDFKGFAEIVFRRNIPCEAIQALPSSYINFLGANYRPIDREYQPPTNQNLTSLDNSKLIRSTKLPTTFILKNCLSSSNCASLFHQISSKVITSKRKSINFKSPHAGKIEQTSRCEISHAIISEIDPNYLSSLYIQASSDTFISKILEACKISFALTYKEEELLKYFPAIDQANKTSLVCRIRHFLDLYGYSLDKHNDSPDTLCAFIAPLIPYSTTTSIINTPYYDRDLGPMSISKQDLNPSEFTKNLYGTTLEGNNLHHFKKSEGKIKYAESFRFSPIKLEPGEAILIPNLMSNLIPFKDMPRSLGIMQHVAKNCGHGVLPFVMEPYRPVLLIDYLLIEDQHLAKGYLTQNSEYQKTINLGKCSNFFVPTANP